MGNFWCLNLSNYTIGGNYGKLEYTGEISFKVKKCTKEFELEQNITCPKIEDMKTNSNASIFFSYFTYENVLDIKNNKNPVYIRPNYRFIEFDFMKTLIYLEFAYSVSTIDTDIGSFIPDKVIQEYLTLDEIKMQSILTSPPEDKYIVWALLSITKKNAIHYREYVKVLDVIGNVGGVLSVITPFFDLVLGFLIDNEYAIYLYYSLFQIQSENESPIEIIMKNEVRRQFCYLFELSKKNKIDNVADRRIELNKRRKLYFLLENALNSKYKKAVLYKNVRNLKHAVHQWNSRIRAQISM